MHIRSFLLCDFAQVRDGLLFVSSGGICRLNPSSVPAPMAVMAAIVIEVAATEIDLVHEIKVVVSDPDSALVVAEMTAGFQTRSTQGLQPGEPMQVPLIADLRGVMLERFGQYDVRLTTDGDVSELISLWVNELPSPPH